MKWLLATTCVAVYIGVIAINHIITIGFDEACEEFYNNITV